MSDRKLMLVDRKNPKQTKTKNKTKKKIKKNLTITTAKTPRKIQ